MYAFNPKVFFIVKAFVLGRAFQQALRWTAAAQSLSGKVCKWICVMLADWNPFVK